MLRARDVMDDAAVLYNNATKSVLSYPVQLPYLNMALSELKEYFELYDIPVANETTTEIVVPAGVTEIIFNAVAPNPSLPEDLIEPKKLWERTYGQTENFIGMQKLRFGPGYVTRTSNLIYWWWEGQKIELVGATDDVNVRIDYSKDLFAKVIDPNTPLNVINAKTMLAYRVAGLCAEFIGENKSRADALNIDAGQALDRVLNIGVKGGQAIATRRRPFRSSFKLWNTSL